MDLLDNVATELGFEFHLYVVRDHLFGAKKQRTKMDFLKSKKQSVNQAFDDDHENFHKSSSLSPSSASSNHHQTNMRNGINGHQSNTLDDADIADCKFK